MKKPQKRKTSLQGAGNAKLPPLKAAQLKGKVAAMPDKTDAEVLAEEMAVADETAALFERIEAGLATLDPRTPNADLLRALAETLLSLYRR